MLSDKRCQEIKLFLDKNDLFTNSPELVQIAFTHPSYTNHHNLEYSQNYERLEFLGDAVLKLIASKYLFGKYPDFHEGNLTKIRSTLVSDMCLATFAQKIGLNDFLLLGKVEFNTPQGIPSSISACSFEGLLGALYLSSDFNRIESFLLRLFDEVIDDIANDTFYVNAKAILQEYTQSLDKNLPVYTIKNEFGPEHDKTFEVEVYYNNEFLASGFGKSKKEAQQNAAVAACKKIGIINNENEK